MTDLRGIVGALEEAGLLVQRPDALPAVTGVTDDSRKVEPGMLFCAVEGTTLDGHRFIAEAVSRGASAVVCGHLTAVSVPTIVCRETRRAAGVAAAHWHGHPARQMTVVGVTGTNGKTTTVALIRHLLNANASTGSVGTLGAIDGTGATLPGHDALTTPGSVELQQVLAAFRDRGVSTVVLEASSHALDQGRLETLQLDVGVFTNLTHEHLDYHGDLSGYLRAKSHLIDFVRDGGALVINGDDAAWVGLTPRSTQRVIRFGREAADVCVSNVVHTKTHSDCTISVGDEMVSMTIPLPGHFNVSNGAAAVATAWALGLELDAIAARIATAESVPGRLEPLVGDGFSVIRDYAHTPDALERAITALRPVTTGRLVVLFGAGGDRDKAKRPVMGDIAARFADLVVVTSDNPRTEDPDAIIDDIEAGMPGGDHVRIADRREAVHHAVGLLRDGDCLLLAGKGHETYQVVGTEYLPFDEREIVDEAMRRRRGV